MEDTIYTRDSKFRDNYQENKRQILFAERPGYGLIPRNPYYIIKNDNDSFSEWQFYYTQQNLKSDAYAMILDNEDFSSKTYNHFHIDGTSCISTDFSDCTFINCTFAASNFFNARFRDSSFSGCNFVGSDLNRANFKDCTFDDCRFVSCDLSATNFDEAHFTDTDFLNSLFATSTKMTYKNAARFLDNFTGCRFVESLLFTG